MRKTIYLFLLLLLLCGCSTVVSKEGRPFSTTKEIEDTVADYLASKFPSLQYTITKISFDDKWNAYWVEAETKEKITFQVEVYENGHIIDSYVHQKVAAEGMAEVEEVIKDKVHKPTVSISSYLDNYSIDNELQTFERAGRFSYMIDIRWKDPAMTKDAFIEKVVELRDSLLEQGFSRAEFFFACEHQHSNSFVISFTEYDKTLHLSKEEIKEREEEIVHYF